MPTLLEVLSRANPDVDSRAVRGGLNTATNEDNYPATWYGWSEFNYDTLTTIFSRQLHQQYRSGPASVPDAVPLDLRICNEATLELALHRFVVPPVNHSLFHQSGDPHLGPGARCQDSLFKPDWSCVAHNDYGVNVLPGDTKLSKKWQPTMANSRNDNDVYEWGKVVGQVIGYMKSWKSRYGFIITDQHLVALRITRLPTGEGLAAGRGQRVATTRPALYDPDSSGLESSFANTTLSYVDDEPTVWEIYPPEYAVIPWARHGPGKLTVKLALWCLAMMAANGDNYIDYSYPAPNTWRKVGREYVHNTSGARKRHMSRHDIVDSGAPAQDAPAGSSGGYAQAYSDDGGNGGEAEDGGDGVDNLTYFSQAGTGFEEDQPQEFQGYDESRVNEDEDEDDGDSQTVVPPTNTMKKPLLVKVKKHVIKRTLYFADSKGREVETSASAWTEVQGGFLLTTKKHTYFTKSLP
ncbi:hypothetical protein NKR23_g8927 [Pleurostoma richardsiae]|uniref:Uncharacterized protein n=1 Tax=Pleurostoma richardsiae TaxID=41990 RepID=A0AA38VKN6_9PEZI|nr:hypothetical protein NKR23_g8927 [Pleurostoma richardsiae]